MHAGYLVYMMSLSFFRQATLRQLFPFCREQTEISEGRNLAKVTRPIKDNTAIEPGLAPSNCNFLPKEKSGGAVRLDFGESRTKREQCLSSEPEAEGQPAKRLLACP